MATKKRRSRRRRVGAAGLNLNSPVVKLAAVAGAYFFAADPVNTAVDKAIAAVMPAKDATGAKIPGVPSDMGKTVALGAEGIAAYMLLMKGRSSMVKTLAGAVIAGAALKRGLKKFGVISGYQSVPVLAGYQQVPVLGNGMGARRIAGNGYGVNGYNVNGRNQSVMGSVMDSDVTSGSDLLG